MKATLLPCSITAVLLSLCAANSLRAMPPSLSNDYQLVWWDEFTGTALDHNYWEYENGPHRDAVNTADAVSVADGAATITTYTENGVHYTGFIKTKEQFSQDFGYYEARVMFNDAPGMWSAFWLMPYTIGDPIGQPDIGGVEMDIVEHRKITGGVDIENVVNNGLHWDGYYADKKKTNNQSTQPTLLNGTWHTYGLLWTPTGYTFYFDDQPIWQTSVAVSHRSAHVLLTSEIAGVGWAGLIPTGGYGSHAGSTVKMVTDYVRVYELKPSVSGQAPFVSHPFPGRIEAENFDQGGQAVAYYEKAGSGANGTEYGEYTGFRTGSTVDFTQSTGASNNLYVSHAEKPEWLEYTVSAQTPGYYSANLILSTTSTANGKAVLSIDGVTLGAAKVQNTGGWRTIGAGGLLKVATPCNFTAKVEFFTDNMEFAFDAMDFTYLGNVADLKEAEDATLSGGAVVAETPNASEGETVDLQSNGSSVLWSGVDGFDGGNATLNLRYCANGSTTWTRVRALYVNGTLVQNLSFAGTGSNAHINLPVTVALNPGKTNTIELRNTGNDTKYLNIDYLITSKDVVGATVTPGPDAFHTVRPAACRLAEEETALTLVADDFTPGTTAGWSVSQERLNTTTTGATVSIATGSGINGNALNFASTANFKSALRSFDPHTLAIGDSLTLSFDYRFPAGTWSNASGLWVGFADSSQTILRDTTQGDTASNRTLPAFYATANPSGQSGGSYLKLNQGDGATSTSLGAAYGTAASGTTAHSVEITFTRTAADSLEIVSNLGRFDMSSETITATATTDWFTYDTLFVVKGASSANYDLYIDNVKVVLHSGASN
jgi:beta-glucanase (GH16 family)